MDPLEKSKQKDYYKILLPEISGSNINKFIGIKEKVSAVEGRTKRAIKLPGIGEEVKEPEKIDEVINTPMDKDPNAILPTVEETMSTVDDDSDEEKISLLLDIEDVKNQVQDLERELRLNDMRAEIVTDVKSLVRGLQQELDELKSRKVPVRKEYETENSYKEQLYPQAVNVLDDLIVPLIDAVPDYNLIATQISTTFDDGTIKNGIVTINVMINNNDFRHDFKVDVPILNGLIQAPLYLTRGRKVIPITGEALYEELNSESFIKISPTYRQKDNMFSNIGQNILRQEDHQKMYPTYQPEVTPHGKPMDGTYVPNRQRGLGNE